MVTIVEPRLLVVVTGTPDAVFLVELPLPVGKAVAVVTKVVPRESVVVMATAPPSTKSPIVEVMFRPAESVRVATTTLAVLKGDPVLVIVDTSSVVAEALLLSLADTWLDLLADTWLVLLADTWLVLLAETLLIPEASAVLDAVATMLPPETWARASITTIN